MVGQEMVGRERDDWKERRSGEEDKIFIGERAMVIRL